MKDMKLNMGVKWVGALVAAGLFSSAHALEPKTVTFDNGTEGWTEDASVCAPVIETGGNPGAYWNQDSTACDGEEILRGWFLFFNDSDPSFVGDYTAKGPVQISIDVNVNDFTYYWFGSAVEEYRQIVVEFIDLDYQWSDPATGYVAPYTSVMFPMGTLPNRNNGWKTFTVDIEDPAATELPEGWTGTGGPDDPVTYLPQLPPGVTFADVMAAVDVVVFHAIEPGFYYDYGFVYDIDVDNIGIRELPKECNGSLATIWVDNDGYIRGGAQDGQTYTGNLIGTDGDDVIVGTDAKDVIHGHSGNDLICGLAGDDVLHGHKGNDFVLGGDGDDTITGQNGNDFLDGGEGVDAINGGNDSDTCLNGEIVNRCGG